LCVCEGVEDVVPQLRSVGCSNNVYEDYERLIDKTNSWLRDQPDVNIVNLQSILVQKDTTGALINPLVPSVPKNGTPTLTVNREIIQALMG